jgi:hypothetical protein
VVPSDRVRIDVFQLKTPRLSSKLGVISKSGFPLSAEFLEPCIFSFHFRFIILYGLQVFMWRGFEVILDPKSMTEGDVVDSHAI